MIVLLKNAIALPNYKQVNKGWNDTEALSRWGPARDGSNPKLTSRSSFYEYRYSQYAQTQYAQTSGATSIFKL